MERVQKEAAEWMIGVELNIKKLKSHVKTMSVKV